MRPRSNSISKPNRTLLSFQRWILWLVCVIVLAGSARAQGTGALPAQGRPVVDAGDMLTPTEEQILTQKLVSYEDSTSNQIAVVTIPSLEGQDPIQYAVELGRRWGVGQAGKDNGVVLLVSRDDRTITIAVGYGLEGAIPDALADRIRRNVMVPYFRQGQYYEGISAGVDALIQAAAGEFTADRDQSPGEGGGIDAATIFILLIIAFFIFSSFGGGGRGRGRRRRHYRHRGGPPVIIWGGGFGGGGGWGGGGFGGGGGGGFGGFGGGSFGGGGASGNW